MTSETSCFFNPSQNNILSRARNESSDLNARNSDRSRLLLQNNYLSARVWEDFARHGIDNVISMVDNSAKGKIPINPIDNTINNVKGDKDIGVASRIPNPDKGCDE
ncbi:hypothetical protein RDI58_010515 [Solanum bulbocastanum]|uniref:Uncharacterized protein n=1 Tax=Solanum bulbocastanum TaxID=147425 RepID=A0AAN8TR36_SOLBU